MTQIYAVSHCIVRHLLYTADSQIIIVLFRAVGVCPSYKLESMACFFCRLDKSIQIRRLISAGNIGIISEIGVNMEAFPSAKHLCSWAGLTPTNNESAGKKKSVRVSKAGCYIKPLLVQCANSVVKSEKHPEIRNRYLRLRKRRGHKKAIIAIARMLLTALYNMLKNKEPYNAELYRKSDVLPVNREITIEQAILMAQFQGYKIKSAAE